MLVYSHQQAFQPSSSVAGGYCTLESTASFSSCIFRLLHWYLLFSCSNPAVQPATAHAAHTGWHWQGLLESRNGTPDTRISTFSPLRNCIHFCSSAAFYQSLQRAWKLFNKFLFSFVSNWLWEQCQSVWSMQLVQREQRGWHFSLAHSFTHLLFPISPPLSIYFSFSD